MRTRIGCGLLLLFSLSGCEALGGVFGGGDGRPDLPSCGSETSLLTTAPIADGSLRGLVPLGNLNPPGHTFPTDHVYFYLVQDSANQPVPAPVVAPGDATLYRIESSENLTSGLTDFSLRFAPCDQVDLYFHHVATLSADLAAEAGDIDDGCFEYSTGGNDYQRCSKSVDITLAAGDPVGTAGNPGQYALDLGAIDTRSPALDYANPDHEPKILHAVCPVDYFASPAREALETRFGNYDGTIARTAPPVCGEVEQDEPGTAQGRWYRTGEDDAQEDPHLALVHDNVLPERPMFSVGRSIAGFGGVWTFTVATSGAGSVNRDFANVVPGTTWCWEPAYLNGGQIPDTIIVAELPDADHLLVEKQAAASCGAGPWALGAGAVAFER